MLGVHPIRAGYILLFGVTAIICFSVVPRALAHVEDKDTRVGLTSLLVLSGLWASFHVGRLIVPLQEMKLSFYILGLTVGLATVGAWLYFCSAYTGESYHRQPRLRVLVVATFVSIIMVKFTSPLHGLYFSTSFEMTPFPHLMIRLGALHWVVTGLAYAFSAVGFYMLFDLFQESNYATSRLSALVGLAALPVIFDIIGYIDSAGIITLNYEPIGVGLFAIGVLYVAEGSFLAVRRFGREQLLDAINEGVVVLDNNGIIRDVNDRAQQMFPDLKDGIGEQLTVAAPALSDRITGEESEILRFGDTTAPRYYLTTTRLLTAGQTTIGKALLFTDITEVERNRRQIQQHRQQFDAFAEAITHELRNTLGIIQGHLQLATSQLDAGAETDVVETIETTSKTADRMAGIVTDLATLAEFGRPVESTASLDVAVVAKQTWDDLDVGKAQLTVTDAGEIQAHEIRLQRLLQNLFKFSIGNGATSIELARADGKLVLTDDGDPITDAEEALRYGTPVPTAELGMLLPVVRTLAEAHDWAVRIDAEYSDGVRIVIET